MRSRLPRFLERPRIPGFDYTGALAYHITMVTVDRRRVLVESLASELGIALVETAAKTDFDVLVYCVMPDHLHALVVGTSEQSNLIRFMQRFKQLTAHSYKQRTGRALWQASFHDHALRGDEGWREVAQYILDNPVRAELVESWDAWPYVGGSLVADEGRS